MKLPAACASLPCLLSTLPCSKVALFLGTRLQWRLMSSEKFYRDVHVTCAAFQRAVVWVFVVFFVGFLFVFLLSGHNKMPQTGRLKQHTLFSHSGGQESEIKESACRASSEAPLGLLMATARPCPPVVFSLHA